uniref:Uncharacterized protein n=1 Tax=Noccaea caerulescens TaxID=107243 RepID=A0A1J3IZR5_NOCCA
MKLRRAKEASELSSAQMEAKIKYPSSANLWRSYSTHPELVTKKNQPERIPNEEDIEDTIWKIFNGVDGDIRSLIESLRPNQDEPSNKSNYLGFATHQSQTANWIRDQINFVLRVIDFTNRVNRSFPDLDIGALIGGFRSNQKDISYKSSCYGILP